MYLELVEELSELAKPGSKFAYVPSEQYADFISAAMFQYRIESTIVKFFLNAETLTIDQVDMTCDLPITGYVSFSLLRKNNILHYMSSSQNKKYIEDESQQGLKQLMLTISSNNEMACFIEKFESVLDWALGVNNGSLMVAFSDGEYNDFPLEQYQLLSTQDSSVIE